MNGLEHFRLLHPGWRDLLEIAIVSFVLYRVLLLFQRTRAVRILLGLYSLSDLKVEADGDEAAEEPAQSFFPIERLTVHRTE